MKNLMICATLAVLSTLAPAAGKPNVTNPMTADLDGGGFSLYNIAGYIGHSLAITNEQNSVAVGASPMAGTDPHGATTVPSASGRIMLGDGGYPFFGYPSLTAHTYDPSIVGVDLDTGSLLLRRVDSAHGELWFKTGPLATDWVRIAP